MFEQNQLPHPEKVMDCLDEDLAGKVVDFLTTEFGDGARGGLGDLIDMIQNF